MHEGMSTPWGVALTVSLLDEGILWVQTAEHGGVLLEHMQAETLLSPKAMALGMDWHEFLAFEQNNAMQVVFYEHPELYPWAEEELIQPLAEASLRRTYPHYFDEPLPVSQETEYESLTPSVFV